MSGATLRGDGAVGRAQAEELRERLRGLGFDVVRFASARSVPVEGLKAWLAEGMHGEMAWLERGVEKRAEPGLVLDGAVSVILLGVNYWFTSGGGVDAAEGRARTPLCAVGPREAQTAGSGVPALPMLDAASSENGGPGRPVWARYAMYQDYHDTMKAGLVAAGKVIEDWGGLGARDYRYYVDTGPVLERALAARAGVGFVGKNAMLISREFGNWLFLAAILVRAELPEDEPLRQGAEGLGEAGGIGALCGKCTRCSEACPTQAIVRPGVVDARLCVSYQTIENKGVIPRELRAGIGARVYGCDVCAEVCPWNRFAQEGRGVLLRARRELAELSLRELLELTPERFAAVFKGTAIKRVKRAGLLRNACVVAGNLGAVECVDVLVRLAREESALVRAHAVWAVARIAGTEEARRLLAEARVGETELSVLAEYKTEGI